MSATIPYSKQDILQSDIDAVIKVLRSDFLTQGSQVPAFENALTEYCHAAHAVAMNSATSSLHVACLALGLQKGDYLWTSPLTFVASANCALYCGASVDFVDIDPKTYNLCPHALEKKLQTAQQHNRLPKIVVPVHLCGQPCDMEAIGALAQRYGFYVIEDASHAIGARYQGQPVGNCAYSDICIFSFHPVKIITTAEGGVALCNNPVYAEKMRRLRSHGITRNPAKMNKLPDGQWYYQQIELGFNYRMNEIEAALGISQLSRLDSYVEKRHALAARYDRLLSELPLSCPQQHAAGYSSFHLYVVRLHTQECAISHTMSFSALRELNIGVNLHYIPVHLQPYYQQFGFAPGDFPEAERYYAEAISLPLYPTLSEAQQDRVVKTLKKVLLS